MGRSLLPLSTLQCLKLHSDLAEILFICSAEFSEPLSCPNGAGFSAFCRWSTDGHFYFLFSLTVLYYLQNYSCSLFPSAVGAIETVLLSERFLRLQLTFEPAKLISPSLHLWYFLFFFLRKYWFKGNIKTCLLEDSPRHLNLLTFISYIRLISCHQFCLAFHFCSFIVCHILIRPGCWDKVEGMPTESLLYKWDQTAGVSFKRRVGERGRAWVLRPFWLWHIIKPHVLHLKDKT